MLPVPFQRFMANAGCGPRLAKDVWHALRAQLTTTDMYHLRRLGEGSRASLGFVCQRFTPAMFLTAIEATVPPHRCRSTEVIQVEEALLALVDRQGAWK